MTTASAGSPTGARPEGARSRSDNIAVGAADAPVTTCNPTPTMEETARELLAACQECAGTGIITVSTFKAKCCGGSAWECGAAGCTGAVAEPVEHQIQCSACEGKGAILSALGPPPTEVREGASQCAHRVWEPHLDYAGEQMRPGKFREPCPECENVATPPMRDREAIARIIDPNAFDGSVRNRIGNFDEGEMRRTTALAKADAILSLSPSCDCLVREALEAARAQLMLGDFSTGYCCCGSPVEGHGIGDGHSPVDDGDYALQLTIERIDTALQGPGGEG